MKILSVVSILLVTLLSAQVAISQPRRRPAPTPPAESSAPLPVSVGLKDGQTLKGKFVGATTKKLSLVVGSTLQELNMSEVASLVFSESSITATANTQSIASAREAIAALRRLESATSAGVSRSEYGTRLIDAKATVDSLIPRIADGDLKLEITASIREYVAASSAWQALYDINVEEISRSSGSAGVVHSVPKWILETYEIK